MTMKVPLITAIQIACRVCATQPPYLCFPERPYFHAERIFDAQQFREQGITADSVRKFDRAVQKSGLV